MFSRDRLDDSNLKMSEIPQGSSNGIQECLYPHLLATAGKTYDFNFSQFSTISKRFLQQHKLTEQLCRTMVQWSTPQHKKPKMPQHMTYQIAPDGIDKNSHRMVACLIPVLSWGFFWLRKWICAFPPNSQWKITDKVAIYKPSFKNKTKQKNKQTKSCFCSDNIIGSYIKLFIYLLIYLHLCNFYFSVITGVLVGLLWVWSAFAILKERWNNILISCDQVNLGYLEESDPTIANLKVSNTLMMKVN